MTYKFIDDQGTFTAVNPPISLYFPLTNKDGTLLSSISPNLAGDIKADNEHFITPPVSIEDLRSNLLCRRDFFIKTDDKIIRASEIKKTKVEAGFLYHKVIKEEHPLSIEIINFIPPELKCEVMLVKLTNKSKKSLKLTSTSFMPLYARAEKSLRDHRHVSSLLNRIKLNKYSILLKPTLVFDESGHKENKMTYFSLGFEENAIYPQGQFPTLDLFCGEMSLVRPDAIYGNIKPIGKEKPLFQGKEAIASFRFRTKTLKPKQTVSYILITGLVSSEGKIKKIASLLNSPKKASKKLSETKKYWQKYLSGINFDFKDKNFNNWLLWVRLQPTLRKLFGCSFLPHFDYGKGGRGWRDLWQDALTLLVNEPLEAKKLMLESLKGIRIDGTNATIITKHNNFISDRNKITRVWSDHGIWPYLSLRSYINKTADLNILNQNIPYFQDHLLMRARQINKTLGQSDNILKTKSGKIYFGSTLEHILIQHLSAFFNVGNHNITRLEDADWNDGLDMAAENGESVTFSNMYAHNLRDLCFFLENLQNKQKKVYLLKEIFILLDQIKNPINYNNFKEKQQLLAKYLNESKSISGEKKSISIKDLISDLEKKSNHIFSWIQDKEWLRQGFFNGYYDNNSKKAEGKIGKKTIIFLPSQVFSIMSKIATQSQIREIWKSIKKYLYDKNIGSFRLNTDLGKIYMELGRAFGFSYGDKENGAFFSHMIIMLSFALYSRGFIKEGSEVINSIYKMSTSKQAQIYPGLAEYYNNEGKGLYLYLTGSASWHMHTLIEEILGIKFCLGNLYINPKLNSSNFYKNTIDVEYPLKNKILKVSYLRKGPEKKTNTYKIRKVLLDNKEILPMNNIYVVKKSALTKPSKRKINLKIYLR